MIERYAVVASRIRHELSAIGRTVAQVQRGIDAVERHPEDQDLYLDSAALNLHDFYAGLERVFEQIAATIDGSVPSGHDWHRELLRQMATDIRNVRPQVLSIETIVLVDEYLRFRHVVRNIYAFEFDLLRITALAQGLPSTYGHVQRELLAFAAFLDELATEP